jgi:hypothetical protein
MKEKVEITVVCVWGGQIKPVVREIGCVLDSTRGTR